MPVWSWTCRAEFAVGHKCAQSAITSSRSAPKMAGQPRVTQTQNFWRYFVLQLFLGCSTCPSSDISTKLDILLYMRAFYLIFKGWEHFEDLKKIWALVTLESSLSRSFVSKLSPLSRILSLSPLVLGLKVRIPYIFAYTPFIKVACHWAEVPWNLFLGCWKVVWLIKEADLLLCFKGNLLSLLSSLCTIVLP